MKKYTALSALLIVLVPLVAFAEDAKKAVVNKSRYLRFESDFCKEIGKKPSLTVCVSGSGKHYTLTSKHLRKFKKEAKKVLKEYKKFKKNFDQNTNRATGSASTCTYGDWDASYCDPENRNRSFCEVEVGV